VAWWDRYVWRRAEHRQQLTLEQLLADQGTPTAAGEAVTVDRALKLSAVWACVRLLADSVSTLPLDVYRRGDRTPLQTAPALLQRPSADVELADWLYAAMASLLVRGNCYGIVTARAGGGLLPAQVDLVHPDRMGVTVNGEGRITYRLLGDELDPADVWHVRAYVFPGVAVGLSPIEYARETIGLGLAAERYGAKFFGDSAVASGVLSSDHRIGPDAAEALQARWEARHKGKRRIAVLGDGATFQPVTIPNDQAQWVESQQFNVNAVARIFGVPGEMVGGQTAGPLAYTSPEQRGEDFLTYSVRPWLLRVERAVSRLLPRNQFARFNAGGFVRVALKDRYEAHKTGIEAGFLTVNEARELEDRPPLPEGGAVA
jgi:HK97 family phage portal protein